MNILPKKRWHVRTKDNIARVRKDEAAAREEERKKQEKLELAESEARLSFLRKRSGLPEKHTSLENSKEESSTEVSNKETTTSQHFNLFADYKSHVKTTNKELEKEKKEEQEKYEKQIGYLTYLGQDTNEALRLKSWYEVAPKRLDIGSERGELNEKDLKNKHNHDPLTLINALLPPEPKPQLRTTPAKQQRSPTPQTIAAESNYEKQTKKHKKEHKKHKKEKHKKYSKEHKHKKKVESNKRDIEDEKLQKRLKLEQLRKERLRRETAERARQEALLAPKETKKSEEAKTISTPRVVQKYNSQFNPELAKQNMN